MVRSEPKKNKILVSKEQIAPNLTDGDAVAIFSELAIGQDLTPSGGKKANLILGPIEPESITKIVDGVRLTLKAEGKNSADFQMDLSRYSLEIPSDEVVHANNRYGLGNETKKDQIGLELSDFSLISSVIRYFDKGELAGIDGRGRSVLKFMKRINGIIVLITAIRNPNKGRMLSFDTMWKVTANSRP